MVKLLQMYKKVEMGNFGDTLATRKQSFICAFSICMTAPLKVH